MKDYLPCILLCIFFILWITAAFLIELMRIKRQQQRSELQKERSKERQQMSCNKCAMLNHYQQANEELHQEKAELEATIRQLTAQNEILQSSSTKAKLHYSENKKTP